MSNLFKVGIETTFAGGLSLDFKVICKEKGLHHQERDVFLDAAHASHVYEAQS